MSKGKWAALAIGGTGIALVVIPATRRFFVEAAEWVAGFARDAWASLHEDWEMHALQREAASQMTVLHEMLKVDDPLKLARFIDEAVLPDEVKALMRQILEEKHGQTKASPAAADRVMKG